MLKNCIIYFRALSFPPEWELSLDSPWRARKHTRTEPRRKGRLVEGLRALFSYFVWITHKTCSTTVCGCSVWAYSVPVLLITFHRVIIYDWVAVVGEEWKKHKHDGDDWHCLSLSLLCLHLLFLHVFMLRLTWLHFSSKRESSASIVICHGRGSECTHAIFRDCWAAMSSHHWVIIKDNGRCGGSYDE